MERYNMAPQYANAYTGGYTPPNYGYNPYQPGIAQNVMQATQERLQAVTNQAQNYLQGPQAQQQPQQAAQPQQIAATVVTSIDQVKAAAPDLSGARRMFYDTSANRIYIRQFNMATGLEEFHTYERQTNDAPQESVTQKEQSPETAELQKPSVEERIQELNCKLSGVIAKNMELEEKLNEYAGNCQCDGTAETRSGTVDAEGAGDGADGAKRASNTKSTNAKSAVSKQSDAAKSSGEK